MERRTAPTDLSRSQIEAAVDLYAGTEAVQSYELLQTGRANTNYLVATSQRQLVLRLHVRDAKSCAKERALHELLEDSVPLAPLLGSSESTQLLGHPFSLLAFVNGTTLERALQGGAEIRLECMAPALGAIPNLEFEFGSVVLLPGDTFIAFTDGVVDALDSRERQFGEEQFLNIVRQGSASVTALLGESHSAVKKHIGSASQYADITLFAIKRNPLHGAESTEQHTVTLSREKLSEVLKKTRLSEK